MSISPGHDILPPGNTLGYVIHTRTMRSRNLKLGLVSGFLLLLITGVAANILFRSESYLKSQLSNYLTPIENYYNIDVRYNKIRAIGLLGIELTQVEIWSRMNDHHPLLEIEQVIISPSKSALIQGNIYPLITISGAKTTITLGTEDDIHLEWLRHFKNTKKSIEGDATGTDQQSSRDLQIKITDLHLNIEDKKHNIYTQLALKHSLLKKTSTGIKGEGILLINNVGKAILSGEQQNGAFKLNIDMLGHHNYSALIPPALYQHVSNPNISVGAIDIDSTKGLVIKNLYFSGLNLTADPRFFTNISGAAKGLLAERPTSLIKPTDFQKLTWFKVEHLEILLSEPEYKLNITNAAAGLNSEILQETYTARIPQIALCLDKNRKPASVTFTIADENGGTLALSANKAHKQIFKVKVQGQLFNLQFLNLLSGNLLSGLPLGLMSGTLLIDYNTITRTVHLDSDLRLSRLRLEQPFLADEPLSDLSITTDASAVLYLDDHRLVIPEGNIALGSLPFTIEGHLQKRDNNFDAEIRLQSPELDGNVALASIPKGFAPTLEGTIFSGTFSFFAHTVVNTEDPSAFILDVNVDTHDLSVVSFGPSVPIDALDDKIEVRYFGSQKKTMVGPNVDNWVDLDVVPKHLINALTSAEDGHFFSHNGFDLAQIEASLKANIKEKKIVRGGSTLTQQVARLLFLSTDKTVSRKFQEMVIAWMLETHLTKEQILEYYLNTVHWGPGIYGIRQTSRSYFRKRVSRLTVRESVFLASILPNPNRFGNDYIKRRVKPSRLKKMKNILLNMRFCNHIGPKTYKSSLYYLEKGIISIAEPPKTLDPNN